MDTNPTGDPQRAMRGAIASLTHEVQHLNVNAVSAVPRLRGAVAILQADAKAAVSMLRRGLPAAAAATKALDLCRTIAGGTGEQDPGRMEGETDAAWHDRLAGLLAGWSTAAREAVALAAAAPPPDDAPPPPAEEG